MTDCNKYFDAIRIVKVVLKDVFSKIFFYRYDEHVTMVVVDFAIKCPKICGSHGPQYLIQGASSTCLAINSIHFDFIEILFPCKKNTREK